MRHRRLIFVIPDLFGDLWIQMNSIGFEEFFTFCSFFTLPKIPAQGGDDGERTRFCNRFERFQFRPPALPEVFDSSADRNISYRLRGNDRICKLGGTF
jgi:hypothetical protein